MNNLNTYTPRMGQMASSSMFFPSTNNDFKKNYGFSAKSSPFDSNVYGEKKAEKTQQKSFGTFPNAMLSHSMIDMNSSSNNRRVPLGKLDSMARKVDTAFKDDANDKKDTKVSTNPA